MKAFTDYPMSIFGDPAGQPAPVREVQILNYDGNKYCDVMTDKGEFDLKAGYLYKDKDLTESFSLEELHELIEDQEMKAWAKLAHKARIRMAMEDQN